MEEKKLPIEQLKPGMYVIGVTRQSKTMRIKSPGYIKNQEGIDKLLNSGIQEVVVDPSKDKSSKQSIAKNIKTKSLKPAKNVKPDVSMDQEMGKASKLYGQAKNLQKRLLTNIQAGKALDMEPIQQTTENIVESIFRNQDALTCMSRLRNKDDYLMEHSLNVSILMSIFAKHLGEDKETINELALGAFLHDIGKILIPDEILNKPGRLTDDEFEIMRTHAKLGAEIVAETPGISKLVHSVVVQHHERLDGNGYPNKLSAEQIDRYGRMIAIVDSYDAMTADRCYKDGMHPIKAFHLLKQEAEKGYDLELVNEFIQCLGVYPVGTLVKLQSGKLGLISQLNKNKPLNPHVHVFYNARMNQAIPMVEMDLSKPKYQDRIECCIKPEEFNLNLLGFFKAAFLDG